MKPIRSLAALAAAAAFVATPVAAQGVAELLGAYHLTMTSKSGTECPDGDDEDLSIEIRRISGEKMMFGEVDDSDEEIAQFDPAARTFRFEQAASEGGSERSGVFAGRFTRLPDAIRLDMTVDIEGCSGKLTGFRPAPLLAATLPAGPTPPTAASEAATSTAAAAPATAGAAQPTAGMDATRMAMLGAGGLGLLAVGVGIGWLLNRRKPGPPPDSSDTPDA